MWRMKGALLHDDVRHKDNLLILPKSLFRIGKVVTWAEPAFAVKIAERATWVHITHCKRVRHTDTVEQSQC